MQISYRVVSLINHFSDGNLVCPGVHSVLQGTDFSGPSYALCIIILYKFSRNCRKCKQYIYADKHFLGMLWLKIPCIEDVKTLIERYQIVAL